MVLTQVFKANQSHALAIILVDRTISVFTIVVLGSIAYVISSKPRGGGMKVEEIGPVTERTHGLGFGRFVAGFIGIVAMAALVTGAVAASNAPSNAIVTADPTDTLATDTAGATTKATATIVATESPSSAASSSMLVAPNSSPTEEVKPGASCNPSLDNREDASERQATGQNGDQNGDNDDQSPNASASATL